MGNKSKIKIAVGKQRKGAVEAKVKSKPMILDRDQRRDIKFEAQKSEIDSLKAVNARLIIELNKK